MTFSAPTYNRILVPLDGSDAAEYAIPYAADLARTHHAELVLVYLDHPTGSQARASLTTLANRLREEGLRVEEYVIVAQETPGTLFEFIESERISVIVMSTQGRTSMLRWVFGNQIETALSHLPVPLLLARPFYQKIVVPLDGSKWSESAIPKATELARAHNAELILLHVYQSPTRGYTDQLALAGQQQMADQTYEQIRDQLVSLRNRLRQEGLRVREQIIRGHNPAQAICEFAESEEGISMVVMSTHGRTGISRWLLGSVAQTVMKELRCPVTLVHPDVN
jgi:nucleotide-binding universal stress UspA family protein